MIDTRDIKEPTPEQCNTNAKVAEDETEVAHAIWYPQMGGYSGKAVAIFSKGDGNDCFDVLVWHDGEFPFGDENGEKPLGLHHCSPGQFVDFGKKIAELQGIELEDD